MTARLACLLFGHLARNRVSAEPPHRICIRCRKPAPYRGATS